MTMEGETVGAHQTKCIDCGKVLTLDVLKSGAGYYIGFWCTCCGPYSRESGYYPSEEAARKDLNSDVFGR